MARAISGPALNSFSFPLPLVFEGDEAFNRERSELVGSERQ
jgi:hypothetical protein